MQKPYQMPVSSRDRKTAVAISLIYEVALSAKGLLAMTTLFVLIGMPLTAQEKKQEMGGSEPLSEEIKYEIKEKLNIQKIPPVIELDVQELVESGTARTDTVLQEAKPIPSDEDFAHYASLNSRQVISPWSTLIPEPPLVTFYPGLSKVASKRWEFRVSDQGGDVVKIIQGNGVPPRQFAWDGLNTKGKYINVGMLYSYQFITYDEHGNAHTFQGEPFELDALKYVQKGKLHIELSNNKLFMDDQAVIRPSMKGLWDRALDNIRENSNMPLAVEMYSQSVQSPLAEERRLTIVNAISDATNIPSADIRHKIDKISDRGDIVLLVLKAK